MFYQHPSIAFRFKEISYSLKFVSYIYHPQKPFSCNIHLNFNRKNEYSVIRKRYQGCVCGVCARGYNISNYARNGNKGNQPEVNCWKSTLPFDASHWSRLFHSWLCFIGMTPPLFPFGFCSIDIHVCGLFSIWWRIHILIFYYYRTEK